MESFVASSHVVIAHVGNTYEEAVENLSASAVDGYYNGY